jgi:hypothetical protein
MRFATPLYVLLICTACRERRNKRAGHNRYVMRKTHAQMLRSLERMAAGTAQRQPMCPIRTCKLKNERKSWALCCIWPGRVKRRRKMHGCATGFQWACDNLGVVRQ